MQFKSITNEVLNAFFNKRSNALKEISELCMDIWIDVQLDPKSVCSNRISGESVLLNKAKKKDEKNHFVNQKKIVVFVCKKRLINKKENRNALIMKS